MPSSSDLPSRGPAAQIILVLGLLALSLGLLALFTIVICIRTAIYHRFKREFLELHKRRVARARLALAGEEKEAETAPPLLAQAHSFSGFLTLGEDGAVTIAGQSFRPGETFAATARDANHIPRAKVASNGSGEVLITSHGQNFRAKFTTGSGWDVQLVEDGQP